MDGDLGERLNIAERLTSALFESHERTESELRTLAKSQVFLSEAMQKTDERMSETTEKLNALINFMDQHLREHREKG